MTNLSVHKGGCHCGAVTWEADLPDDLLVEDCNCSMCAQIGFLHVIIPKSRFRLLTGEEKITNYQFGHKIAKHYFCSVCGVKSFYVPRSNPDGVSLNLRCMDRTEFNSVTIEPFDGQNWEENAHKLADRSKE